MAQKPTKKRFNLNIDEEKDVFLCSLNKKIRNARKKIDQIEELEKKGKDNLKKEQLDKVNSRAETLEVIRYNESIKDLYYGALKAAQDEGKALPQQESQPRKQTEEDKTEQASEPTTVEEPREQAPATEAPVSTQEDNSSIIRETLSKVLNLVHFAQLFRDQSSVQGFRQAFDARRDEFGVDAVPDFESFHEFFVKVFTFSESDRFGKVGDKIERSLGELESYINSAEQPALRNKSYRHLQSVVESIAQVPFFRNHNAEVEAPKARTHTEPSAIGSELRKGVEHQEPAAAPAVQHQEKARSPEKEARTQPEPTRTAEKPAQQEETRKDWGSLEDEDEEEELVEENQQEKKFEGEGGRVVEEDEKLHPTLRDKQEEKKQEDDGFISVKPKYKEKKEETGYRGSGTRPQRGERGGRGRGAPWGERGGYRKPREGEEGQEGGYRRPRREDQQEGTEGGEGQRGERGGYRGNRGGRGQGRGQGRGEGRGGRSYYGDRREGQGQGERTTGTEGVRTGQENA